MNEQLQKNLTQLTDFLAKSTGQVYDFSKQEVPLFIQEYLAWYYYENLFYAMMWLLTCIVLSVIAYKSSKHLKLEGVVGEANALSAMFALIILVCFSISMKYTLDCVKVKVAPRVILMNEARHLMR
jgi:hypothetical protein